MTVVGTHRDDASLTLRFIAEFDAGVARVGGLAGPAPA